MFVNILRIIKYGFSNFWRNGWLSVSTIIIIILALFVFEGLIIFNYISNSTISAIEEKIDISVYFKSNVLEDKILNFKRTLEGLDEIKEVEYISQEEALKIFKEKHKDDEVILKTLEELKENPLLASLNIKAKDPNQYETIAKYLENSSFNDIIEKITYAQNKLVIDRLNRIINLIEKIGFLITLFLAITAILVTFNTIRLAIYSNKEQIEIMRLVGASNNFIRGPYLIEGIIYGVIAGILSFIIWWPIIFNFSPYFSSFINEINLKSYLQTNFFKILLYQIIFGIILGIISSFIAIRRYLKT